MKKLLSALFFLLAPCMCLSGSQNILSSVFFSASYPFDSLYEQTNEFSSRGLTSFQSFAYKPFVDNLVPKKRPKIIIFTSQGGSAHVSACKTLKDLLPDCDIKLIKPLHDFFEGAFDGEALYDTWLQKGWFGFTNVISRYPGQWIFQWSSRSLKKRFVQCLEEERPDLLISVIPLINYPAAWAAQYCNIPFLLITLDADLTVWLTNMAKCRSHNFTVTVAKSTPRIERDLAHKHIPAGCVRSVGYPVRKEFFERKDLSAIRKEWKIPLNKQVIMLIRGGSGSKKLATYAQMLMKINKPLHLLVCIGKNTKLAPQLEHIAKKNKGPVSLSIIPFTSKIPDLMAISDLLIAQPSPTVCHEAMTVNLPIIIDRTSTCLFWEKAAIDWIVPRGGGVVCKKMSKLNGMVVDVLEKKAAGRWPKAKPLTFFDAEIYKVIRDLLEQKKSSQFHPFLFNPSILPPKPFAYDFSALLVSHYWH